MAGKRTPKNLGQTSGGSARRLVAFLLTLAAVGGLVWGVKRLGDSARRGIGPRDRYEVRFSDIECNAPPGFDRRVFLAEVRFASSFPETFQSIDADQLQQLRAAFHAHPWVAGVEAVTVEPDNIVRVKLKFREPALSVRVKDGSVRVVDTTNVLLPNETSAVGLPELLTPVPPPPVPSGRVWPDETVKRAAELVEAHHPRKVEKTAAGWRLTMPDGKTLAVEK